MAMPLERLLPAVLFDVPWDERRSIIDENAGALVSTQADGRLAVIAHSYSHDPEFGDRVGAVRNALELGRFDGFDGIKRPLSYYFSFLYAEGAQFATFVEPTPSPVNPPGDEADRRVAFASMAFIQAPTWETRRRIAVGYPDIVLEGPLEGVLTQLGESAPLAPICKVLEEVLVAARKDGVDVAFARAPAANAFLAAEFAQGDAPLLLREEAIAGAWSEYLESPTWHRRREILQRNQFLLDPELEPQLNDLWKIADSHLPANMVEPARTALDRARNEGIDAAFAGDLGPSHVMIAPAANAFRLKGTDMQQASNLRRMANFVDPGIMPRMRSILRGALADALLDLHQGPVRAEAVEEAYAYSLDAINGTNPDADAERWRKLVLTLGRTYQSRLRGDRTAATEAAINCFERAGRSAMEAGDRATAAYASIQLAQSHMFRRTGIRAQNLEIAVKYGEQGLEFYRQNGDKKDVGWASIALGQAYRERLFGEKADNQAQAIKLLSAGLTMLDKTEDQNLWGSAQIALAGVLVSQGMDDAREAIPHLEAALAVFTRDRWEIRWAETQVALGAATLRSAGTDQPAIEKARGHYLAALEVFDANGYPVERRRALHELAATFFRERRWQEALETLTEAIALGQWLELGSLSDAARLAEISDLTDVYERAAYCLTKVGRVREALPLLDSGKTRAARRVLDVTPGASELSLAQARQAFRAEAATVVPVITSQGSLLFVFTPNQDEPPEGVLVDLPDLRSDDLRALLDGTSEHDGWFAAYHRWLTSQNLPPDAAGTASAGNREVIAAQDEWALVLAQTCGKLWDLLMGPIHEALGAAGIKDGATIRVLPSKWLYLLPLHAAWHRVDGQVRIFLEDYAVAYAPSAWMLAECQKNLQELDTSRLSLLAMIDPTGDLRYAKIEGDGVKGAFGKNASALSSQAATVEALLTGLHGASHLHFACHGAFDWLDPGGSGISLAGGSLLSAREVASLGLERVRLVTLSACETGITDSDQVPNEYVGLAGSFIQAGASTVVCSLWSVDDESTAKLMSSFYQRHVVEKKEPAAALREAQLELAHSEQFSHPFFWAPFQIVGA